MSKVFMAMLMIVILINMANADSYVEQCDVDDYIIKAIGIEEPWIENAVYGFTQFSNNKNGQLSFYPEVEAKFSNRLGAEIDLPSYVSDYPIGKGNSGIGAVTIGPKVLLLRKCDFQEGKAYLLTFETEFSYSPIPNSIASTGNSLTEQIEYGVLSYPYFSTGELGYTEKLSNEATNGYFVNISLGRNITPSFAVQLETEADNQYLYNDKHALEGFLMPQVEYHISGWLLGVGEQASLQEYSSKTEYSTWVMIEREF